MATTKIRAIVCAHVFRDEREVAVFIRHSDGEWQAVCGQHDHPADCSNFEVVHLKHLVERQPDLRAVIDLRPGFMAERLEGRWALIAHDD